MINFAKKLERYFHSPIQKYWQKYRIDLGFLVLYGFITLIVTYPVGFRLSTHIAG